ncbi:hypothetical protein D3C72_1374880 [compost metagenome]
MAVGEAREAAGVARVHGALGIPGPAAEAGRLVIGEGLHDVVAGVADEGAVLGDGLGDRAALQHQHAVGGGPGDEGQIHVRAHLGAGVVGDGRARDPQPGAFEEVERAVGAGLGRRQRPGRAGLHRDRPDGHVGVGLGGPRVRRGARGALAADVAGHHQNLGALARVVEEAGDRQGFAPQHLEVRLGHLARAREVEPDLEELDRVGAGRVEQGEHLRMDDALARRQPLHVARAEARRGAERVGVVDVAVEHDGDGLEAAVRVPGEARHHVAVVHAPAVDAGEVLADVAAA